MNNKHIRPYIEILEQPASRAVRFRYECESKLASCIPGINSTPRKKTFPAIRIVGKKGPARVVVSCVTKDTPYKPHPYFLEWKKECYNGVCVQDVPADLTIVTFPDLNVKCVKKNDVKQSLEVRRQLRVDPFRTGFKYGTNPHKIDLTTVRLCFQVFLEGSEKGKFNVPLPPIVSNPIYDKRAMPDLVIRELCEHSASVAGGKNIILLCEKIAKENIQIRFFEEKDGQLLWEGYGDFRTEQIHKRTAISFKTPRYHTQEVEQPVEVFIQLRNSTDGTTSEALPFQLLPPDADDADSLKRKRRKFNDNSNPTLCNFLNRIETKKHAALNFNRNDDRWMIPFEDSDIYDADFALQPVKLNSHSSNDTRSQRSESPQIPSLIEPTIYNLPQHQYQPNIQPVMQQSNVSPTMDVPLSSYVSDQWQLDQPEANFYELKSNVSPLNRATPETNFYELKSNVSPLNRATPENQELQPVNNIQNEGPEVSPEQILPVEYGTYEYLPQQRYQPNIQPTMQQRNMDVLASSYVPDQPERLLLLSNGATPENQEQQMDNIQNQSPRESPGPIPFLIEYSYNLTKRQYQPDIQSMMQEPQVLTTIDVQPSHQPQIDSLILSRVTPEDQGESQSVNDTNAMCFVNTDNQEICHNSDTSDHANFDDNLSKTLSELSVSDVVEIEVR